MEILVIGPESSARLDRFEQSLRSIGSTPRRCPPRTPQLPLSRGVRGIVFFDDPAFHLPQLLLHVREQVAFLPTPILLAVPPARVAGVVERLSSCNECRLLPADVDDAALLAALQALPSMDAAASAEAVEPLVAAAAQTLGEMAQTEATCRAAYCRTSSRPLGEIVATLSLQSACWRSLSLGVTEPAALTLTRRVLGETAHVTDHRLIDDCMGEIVNVIAGQAKALLAETAHHFTFTTPTVCRSAPKTGAAESYLVIALGSDIGPVALELNMRK